MSTPEIEEALRRAREAAAEVDRIESEETSTEVATTKGVDVAAERKAAMVKQRALALHAKAEADAAQKEVRDLIEQEKNRLQQMQWALEKELAPLKEKVARMGDGIHALNIFLGRGEEIIVVRDTGERAPADAPITVRQMVLAMDEESLIAVDSGGMDFQDVDVFAAWLDNDDHIAQVIPDQKGVVAIVPRRAPKKYEDPWMADAAAEENARTYWIIRNGECLWITTTEFTVGNRVVPSDKEFTSLFETRQMDYDTREYVTRPLQPGTAEWEKAEKISDLRTRHYMKVALLLEGLVERTTVFHPHTGVSFLDQSHFDDGRVQIIMDADNSLSTGRPSFHNWQREKMSLLREGMRVVGAFATHMRTYPMKDYGSADVHPTGATPSNSDIYTIREAVGRSYRKWMFSFTRKDANIWDDELREFRAPKTKGTGYLDGSERWVVPLDLVTVEEIDYYLNSRVERHDYLDMIPTLRAAKAIIEREREEEAPFRTALIGSLSATGTDIDDAPALADDLISWFKTANKWGRALESKDTNASRAILAEAKRRRGGSDDSVIEKLRSEHPDALVIARRSSDLVVIERTARRYENEPTNIFVTVHTYGLRGALKNTAEWQTLRRSQIARWTILHHSDEWQEQVFDVKPSELISDELIDDVIAFVTERYSTVVQIAMRPNGEGADVYVMDEPGVDIPRYYRENAEAGDGRVRHGYIEIVRSARGITFRNEGVFGGERDLSSKTKSSDRVVWQSEHWIAVNNERIAARNAARAAYSAQTRKIIGYVEQIEKVWLEQREAALFARFMEDFGDESLWEGHRKTIKVPRDIPVPSRYDLRRRGDHWWKPQGIAGALEALVEREESPAGRTVRDVVVSEGFEIDKIDESVLEIVFPVPEVTEPSDA